MSIKVTKAAGLYTSDNPYGSTPEGSFSQADNVVVRNKDIVEPRRGQENVGYTFGAGSDNSKEVFFFGTTPVVHTSADALVRDTGAAFSAYSGTYAAPSPTTLRMKFAEAAQNLYFTTSAGTYVLESAAGTPAKAGVPTAFNDFYPSSGVSTGYLIGSSGWLPKDYAVAYRYVWGVKDSHSRIKLGPPSERLVVRNRIDVAAGNVVRTANVTKVTAFAHNFIVGDVVTLLNTDATFVAGNYTITAITAGVDFSYADVAANATSAATLKYTAPSNVTFLRPRIPPGITTSNFLRVYRSAYISGADEEPSDEMFLVYETVPTSTDISNKFMATITDRTPESMLNDPLYTNASVDGILAAKHSPPLSRDLQWWGNRLWYANTKDKHRFHLRILGVGSPDGIQNNDTITIGGHAYTAKTSPTSTAYEFYAGTVYDASQNLIRAINAQAATDGVVAYYESGVDDGPGKILLESVALGGSAFTVYASRPASWGPALTTGSSGAQSSSNDARIHGLNYSALGEPEAVPLVNYLTVGSENANILRIHPLRDRLFVFKEDGIFTVSGEYPFRVDPFDLTVKMVGPDTLATVNNKLFCLTNQGFVSISDAGVAILSRPFEKDLMPMLLNSTPSATVAAPFGVGYETERTYMCWIPNGGTIYGGLVNHSAYVYNVLTNAWTKRTDHASCGRVSPYDYLYLGPEVGSIVTNTLMKERKSFDATDYSDVSFTATISAVGVATSTTQAVQLASIANVNIGDYIVSGSAMGVITAVPSTTVTVTFDSSASSGEFAAGAATIYSSIACALVYNPQLGGDPGVSKQFPAVSMLFGQSDFDYGYITTSTELNTTAVSDVIALGAAATSAFPKNVRRIVPLENQRGTQLAVGFTIREARSRWRLYGHAVELVGVSERISR